MMLKYVQLRQSFFGEFHTVTTTFLAFSTKSNVVTMFFFFCCLFGRFPVRSCVSVAKFVEQFFLELILSCREYSLQTVLFRTLCCCNPCLVSFLHLQQRFVDFSSKGNIARCFFPGFSTAFYISDFASISTKLGSFLQGICH